MKSNFLRMFLGIFFMLSCLVIADFRISANDDSQKSLADLTMKIISMGDASGIKDNSRVVEERFQLLSEMVEKNPSEVLRFALPQDVLAKMPHEFFESREELSGRLEVIYECDDETHRLRYFLNTQEERLPLYFAEETPEEDLTSGLEVSVKGVRVGDKIVLEELEKETVEPNNLSGQQNVLVLMVNFQNDTRQPFTQTQASNLIFGTSGSTIANYYREASYQQMNVSGNVFGWFTLPINTGDCNGTTTASAAKQAARDAGINLSNYNKIVYIYPNMSACGYSGFAQVGGTESWINGSFNFATITHELGHSFGLYHAKRLDCGEVVVGSNCTITDYGHLADIMGGPGATGHFYAFHKERLGWLDSSKITTVQSNGTYTIAPFAAQDGLPKVLKILKSVDSQGRKTWYHIEFRRAIGFDSFLSYAYSNSNLTSGLMISMNKESTGQENYHLDMTPETTSWTDSALVVGRSYTDAGFTITPISVSSSGAVVDISFGSQPTCVTANPTISATPTATQWIGAGSAVNYTVTVTNNNNSVCSANTFNLQANVPLGWSSNAPASLYVAPGASVSTNVQVVSPGSATNGFYNADLNASNALNGATSNTVSANLAVYSSLVVTATSNASSYASTQTATFTANVSANGSSMSGASVTFTVRRPNGTIAATGTAVSNANGTATFSYKFNRKQDPAGTYTVTADAALNGVSGTGTASFVLTK